MAQPVPVLNYGALKVSLPANLPRNEKDLICMILAGRLKDIWNGKLLCAELAIKSLLQDAFAKELQGKLIGSLLDVNRAINEFKEISGYNRILGAVNGALSKLEYVFSLGGMCPSTVKAPRIPDVIGELNANLFGQANGILNSLINIPNAKACLSGGPKGLSLDWNGDQISGSLVNIKKLIENATVGTVDSTLERFAKNLDYQTRKLNAEIARLNSNISDPLGINDKKDTASSIQYTKNVSDGITVKDRNGVEYENPTRTLVTGEIDTVLDRDGSLFADPVRYEVVEVLDYCGKVTGYEKKIVTGDPNYAGWDMVNTDLYDDTEYNTRTGTDLPQAEYKNFNYTFVEDDNGDITVVDSLGETVSEISLQRGRHYRIGFQLLTKSVVFYNGNSVWYYGIGLANNPEYGRELDLIQASEQTVFSPSTIEIDWAVAIEIPSYQSPFTRTTTPGSLTWKTTDLNQTGSITVTGLTSIPDSDKAYDVSMAANKAWLFRSTPADNFEIDGETVILRDETEVISREYSITTTITDANGTHEKTSVIANGLGIDRYTVVDDYTGYVDSDGVLKALSNPPYSLPESVVFTDEGELEAVPTMKIVKITQDLGNGKYLIVKKYINDYNGIDLHQINCYLTTSTTDETQGFEQLVSLSFDQPLNILNDIKLPFTNYYDYKLVLPDAKTLDTQELTIEKDTSKLIINLSNRNESNVGINEFIYTSEIEVNDLDPDRTYTYTDPVELQTYMYFRGTNGFIFEVQIDLVS